MGLDYVGRAVSMSSTQAFTSSTALTKWQVHPSLAGGPVVVVRPLRVRYQARRPPTSFARQGTGLRGACGEQRDLVAQRDAEQELRVGQTEVPEPGCCEHVLLVACTGLVGGNFYLDPAPYLASQGHPYIEAAGFDDPCRGGDDLWLGAGQGQRPPGQPQRLVECLKQRV